MSDQRIDIEKIKSWSGVISARVIPASKSKQDYRIPGWIKEKNGSAN